MENNEGILSNDEDILCRIRKYQDRLMDLSYNPLKIDSQDRCDMYDYQKTCQTLIDWCKEILPKIEEDGTEEEVKRCYDFINDIALMKHLEIVENNNHNSFGMKRTYLTMNEKNYNLMNEKTLKLEIFLKQKTNKYFTTNKYKSRLIK